MTEEKKKELFPFFALLYSKELNPQKYEEASTFEEWSVLLENSPEDIEKITTAASELTDEQWSSIELEYIEQNEEKEEDTILAKKGLKLENLKKLYSYKKGKKIKVNKCSCGCDMITVKEKGGKITSKCSCNCKGGKLK